MAHVTNCRFILGLLIVFLTVLNSSGSSKEEDVFPKSKLSQNIGGPTMKILYCYSCGYRKAFDEYVTIIQSKYQYITIEGANYEPPGMKMFMARVLGFVKMIFMVCILSNINLFHYINLPQPSWWAWCLENKIYSCLMLFFFSNLIEGQLIQSGAFEISLNDVPVWSKIETGRIPQPTELFQIIDAHLKFTEVNHNYHQ